MKKSKLFIASVIVTIFGVLGVIIGLSDLRIDFIVFYISVLLIGRALFYLNKERQFKRQMQQLPFRMNVAPIMKNKGLKNWKTLFILAAVMFIVASLLPAPSENDGKNDSSLTNATEVITKKLDEPTEKTTAKPTAKPTEKLTEEITESPTKKPTELPTEEPTEEPTKEPTEPPTEKPTEPPTEKPTEAQTENIDTNNNFNTYNNVEQQTVTEYVLNTSTMKVHRSSCGFVPKISPENVQYTYDLAAVLASGYEGCKKCNP